VVTEAADVTRTKRLELPPLPGLPEIHLRFILADRSYQTHRPRRGFLDPQIPHLANQRIRRDEDLVVEAILPPGIPEKR